MEIERYKPYRENGYFGWIMNNGEIELEFPTFRPFSEAVEYINNHNVTKLRIDNNSWKKENLDDFKFFPKITGLTIASSFIRDFSGLALLKELKSLSLGINIKATLDLSLTPQLNTLGFDYWQHEILNLNACSELRVLGIGNLKSKNKKPINLPVSASIKDIRISNFSPQSSNLDCLAVFPNLKAISIITGRVSSLEGINKLKHLEEISLKSFSKLSSLNNIDVLNELKKVYISSAKKITNHEVIGNCSSLENLRLVDCGEIKNLNWIPGLKNLKTFNFYGTKISTNDLSPLVNKAWEHLNFSNSRGYSHKLEDMNIKHKR